MTEENHEVSITVSRKIEKYAEGIDPKIGEPYEVVNEPVVLVGKEALDYLAENNIKLNEDNTLEFKGE